MAANNRSNYQEVCRDIRAGKLASVYVLMGEEAYFIDQIEKLIIEKALGTDAEIYTTSLKLFSGADSPAEAMITAARSVPMFDDRQVVVLREAQQMREKELEKLTTYIKYPSEKTILVICHKYKTVDARKSLISAAKKTGVVFVSEAIKDYKMPQFIIGFMKERSLEIGEKAAQMLAEHIGNNLGSLATEAQKLQIVLKEAQPKVITPDIIETNIGISKNYNSFELIAAIAAKDALPANRIINYFGKNPNANPIQQTILPSVFNFFVNLMICFYAGCRNQQDIMKALNLQWQIQAENYMSGLRNYTAKKVYDIVHEIRIADAKSKGFQNNSTTAGEILRELVYKIMH